MATRTTEIYVTSGPDVPKEREFEGQHLVIPSAAAMVIVKLQGQ